MPVLHIYGFHAIRCFISRADALPELLVLMKLIMSFPPSVQAGHSLSTSFQMGYATFVIMFITPAFSALRDDCVINILFAVS